MRSPPALVPLLPLPWPCQQHSAGVAHTRGTRRTRRMTARGQARKAATAVAQQTRPSATKPAPQTASAGGAVVGQSEMAVLMRAIDWSATPIGPAALWPQSLRTAVDM